MHFMFWGLHIHVNIENPFIIRRLKTHILFSTIELEYFQRQTFKIFGAWGYCFKDIYLVCNAESLNTASGSVVFIMIVV
jgi:hypothetical protein